jgi:hypothetical protein
MTYDPNDRTSRNQSFYGLGAGAWTAVIIVIAVLALGAVYWGNAGTKTTASAPPSSTSETTGSAPSMPAQPMPTRPPPAGK